MVTISNDSSLLNNRRLVQSWAICIDVDEGNLRILRFVVEKITNAFFPAQPTLSAIIVDYLSIS
ncbi:MAG: hypothetical protein VYA34_04990 [Myxococcota bacterium]|nr:hypothetical protein [Myxococcota bacterium]